MSLFSTALLFLQLLGLHTAVEDQLTDNEACAQACRAMLSCDAYSRQTCLALEELLGCYCPACSSDCHRRLDENATAPTMGCLGELNCDDGFAALGVSCAFLEDEAVAAGAPESCDCSLSLCAQDKITTYVAPADALCSDYVEDDLQARPCVALTRPATDAVLVKNGDALSVDGRVQHWTSLGRRPVTVEAGATLEVRSVTIDGSFSSEYFAGCVFVGAGSRFSATATTFIDCKAIAGVQIKHAAVAAGGAIAAWTGSKISVQNSLLVAPRATLGGGIFLYAAADAILDTSRISLASAEAHGACAYLDESATLVLSSSHFNGCTAQMGGGFFTQPSSMLQITQSIFERGFASRGGVVLAYGSVYAANSTFRDSFASTYCGGLFIAGSDASFVGEDLVLHGLSSASLIGAVACAGFRNVPPSVTMRRVAIVNCYALQGGSVTIYESIADFEEVFITKGVGLFISKSTVSITRSVIDNSTEISWGGCMSMSSSVVTMTESQLRGCSAPEGGAIVSKSESRLVLRSVVIADSIATEGSGGAALISGSSVLDANAVTIANCTAFEDGGALSVVQDSRVSIGGPSIVEGNVAAGPGGAIAVRASELYVAPRCSIVVFTSVYSRAYPVITLDFSDGGADFVDVAFAWLVKAERHNSEAYFDARGVMAKLLPMLGTRTSLELCLEPAKYELWTVSYEGEAWQGVSWELATPFGDIRDYNEARFSGVGHPELTHGLRAASFKIIGDAEDQQTVRFTGNIASGNGGGIALFDGARLLTSAGSAFNRNIAIGGFGGAIYTGPLCAVDLFGINATRNAAVDGAALAASTLSAVWLKQSTLHANVASRSGGGIFAENIETMALERLALVENIAYLNGGASLFDTSPVVGRDIVCFGNVAHGNGGALLALASHIQLEGVGFLRNRAIEGSGGAVYVANSVVDIKYAPTCAGVIVLLDWTQTTASCPPVLEGNDWVTCDFGINYCPEARLTGGEDACDGCACHRFSEEAENNFEILADAVVGTGSPRAKAIVEYEFCLSPNSNASTYRVITYDDVRGRGWFSGKLHVAVASERGWYPAVEDFSFDGKVGEAHFQVVEVPSTPTYFVQNFAGSGGGALFHDAGSTPAGIEIVDRFLGNTAGYGDNSATPAVSLEFQLGNVTLATSSAVPFQVSAKLLDAKGQIVAINSPLVVDVHWSADVDTVEAVGTRNTTFNGVVDFDALSFMAPVGAMCRMYLKSGTIRSATINVSIVACPPGYEEEMRNDIIQCFPCRANYYWHEGRCRACVAGMLCQDDGTVPLEHRIVGDVRALALERGYHRQSVYSHRPVRCDGGKSNRACPGGIDSIGCNTKKFVLNKPRCQVCSSVPRR